MQYRKDVCDQFVYGFEPFNLYCMQRQIVIHLTNTSSYKLLPSPEIHIYVFLSSISFIMFSN